MQRSNTLFIDFITEFLSRDRFKDDLLVDICEYLVEGNFVVRYGHVPKTFSYEERLKFSPETINWNMEYDNNTNLCQLYLHSLEPVKYLIQGYEGSSKESYLVLASEIIKSWLKFSISDKNNTYTWYDHCASDRVLYLIYFIETVKKNKLEGYEDFLNEVELLLKKHGDFLFDDKNYTTQNHGTMMDRSLYLLSRYANHDDAESWREKSLNRLKTSIQRDFSENMVNLENSSSYHLFNFDLYVVLEKSLLNLFGDSFGTDFQTVINKGVDFLVQLSKPDLNFPVIGDGSKLSILSIKNYPCYKYIHHHEELNYVLTSGNEGSMPEDLFKVYPDEGYAFYRTSWNYKKSKNNITYASFIAGYILKNHKHGDDLSFTYFSHGRDIFIDSGTYTYQAGDVRVHFMAALSHNTIVVDGHGYPFVKGDPSLTGILDYGEENHYNYVVGRNDLYRGVEVTRSFYFLKSGNIVIVDDIQSPNRHIYSQLFHLSHRLDRDRIGGDHHQVSVIDKDIKINIQQFSETNLKIHRGDKNTIGYGLLSEQFNSMIESTSLEYQIVDRNARFITVISVHKVDEEISISASVFGDSFTVIDGKSTFSIPMKTYDRTANEAGLMKEGNIRPKVSQPSIGTTKSRVKDAWAKINRIIVKIKGMFRNLLKR